MILTFRTKTADRTGNKRQMRIDFDNKTVLHGYFILSNNAIILSNKDYEQLHSELLKNGFDFKVAR